MAKELVIVESPTKARTIGRILGSGHTVIASLGHVRDLPKTRIGVDVQNDFTPEYVIPQDKRALVAEIKDLAKGASTIYLATDPDREGEAISWHLIEAAGVDPKLVQRVVFHEITESAVKEAFEHPRALDMDLVDAQQARRVLDRLVGYELSPLVSKKLRWWGLSAGRVQSAALRIVVDRERDVEAFIPVEHWSIDALLQKEGATGGKKVNNSFVSHLHSKVGDKSALNIPDESSAKKLNDDLEGATFAVEKVQVRGVKQRPSAPFITSTLQQEAWRKLRFGARKTMSVAQQLYEGVTLGDQGSMGLITYMRTDSTNVAASAVEEARQHIKKAFGADYVPEQSRTYTRKVKGAQEAHEAIRPTSALRTPDRLRTFLNAEQHRLYDLIWKRFVASQMADAQVDRTTIDIHATANSNQDYLFRTTGSALKFPGFRALYLEGQDDGDEDEAAKLIPTVAGGDALKNLGLESKQHFTEPPPRYSEASLVRSLEDKGIGRPSTYAAIVSTIQDRGYVQSEGGRLTPTLLGMVVSDMLSNHFPQISDLNFTAKLEDELDEVAQGERSWREMLSAFYGPFTENLQEAAEKMPRQNIPTGETCEMCGKPMNLKKNRWGSTFLSCSGFPECRNAKSTQVKTGASCPDCGGDLMERKAKKGNRRSTFYGCSNYPTCNFAVNQKPLPEPCPECSGVMVQRGRNTAKCTKCAYSEPLGSSEQALKDLEGELGDISALLARGVPEESETLEA